MLLSRPLSHTQSCSKAVTARKPPSALQLMTCRDGEEVFRHDPLASDSSGISGGSSQAPSFSGAGRYPHNSLHAWPWRRTGGSLEVNKGVLPRGRRQPSFLESVFESTGIGCPEGHTDPGHTDRNLGDLLSFSTLWQTISLGNKHYLINPMLLQKTQTSGIYPLGYILWDRV